VGLNGDVCGVTTTSGLSFKIPGRVGDSPILGAGLWLDGEIGVAGSTGRGEANLYNLCSHVIVEQMRQGRAPKDAAMEALRRVQASTVEKRLLTPDGRPSFGLTFYVISRTGEYAGVTMWGKVDGREKQFAVCTENGPELVPCEFLLEGSAPA
jgi:N4-(beta-N-acetylglucosaminyl)-L-asparaginase